MIYLDNASAGIIAEKTLSTIIRYLEFEKKHGVQLASKKYEMEILQFYIDVKELIGADSVDEIAFVDSSSRAINLIVNAYNIQKDDRILTLSSEFGTTLLALANCANRVGAEVEILPCQLDGTFSFDEFEKRLQGGVNWVVVSHVSAQGSILNPVEQIGQLAIKYGAHYIVDGCQAAGQVSINVKNINCDAYISSGRKWLCGPRGTGFMYINQKSNLISPLLDVASSTFVFDSGVSKIEITNTAKRFELWERNVASMIGLAQAIENWLEFGYIGVKNILSKNSNNIRNTICKNKKLLLVGKMESVLGTVGFLCRHQGDEIKLRRCLENRDIQISYLKKWECPMFLEHTDSRLIFRISPHYFTSEDAINIICNIISEF